MTQRGLVSGGNHRGCEGVSDREEKKEGGWKKSRKRDLLPRRNNGGDEDRWCFCCDRHNVGVVASDSSACW